MRTTLFNDFDSLSLFQWKFNTIAECSNCPIPINRLVVSKPLINIDTNTLLSVGGVTSAAIILSLSDYGSQCPTHNKEIIVHKNISSFPEYYCCTMDYAEDLQRKKDDIQLSSLELKIKEDFEFAGASFELVEIIYFQEMHYTVHAKGPTHPNFLPNRTGRWFYHDANHCQEQTHLCLAIQKFSKLENKFIKI